ncbi:nicotinate-nucleotide--dimethylbenzimidazole phosphoribosyltransferase [Corynebacterium pilosum]|uniref:Nicotinate-nucleotide--dimethylbenzimidazole phosphoribosyltransferase n=1 Tax=Corynebacterium pilosum TaxID=35756 RepID=A0A376CJ57_9CORY|nr:nicotinate-nucleotide--dimethylbenzimidazole phosphoribosyltransferase [Corynebacterium pilosum]STC68464.1 nicotinate-nucleotide--dimethylbenzimidazole phosphoribosyltransferase [Corynebacterium pilosum]
MFDAVTSPNEAIRSQVSAAVASTPRGASFGRLRDAAAWIAACQGNDSPSPFEQARTIVVAGDHGIAARGISAYPQEASVAQAEEIQAGGGPVHTMARAAGAAVRLVDVSLDRDAWGEERVARSSGAIDVEDAMTSEQFQRAIEIGQRLADQEIDAGADVIIPADLGVGNTTVAAAVFGALTRTEPVVAVGPGSGINDEAWKTKVAVIRDAMFRVRTFRDDLPAVLTAISAPCFVTLVGLIAQAAVRRTPVLIDGAYPAVAAYVAERMAPGTKDWLIAGQLSPEPCHLISLQALDLTPLIALDMSTGQGAGALAALPLLNSAAQLISDELGVHDE